MRLISEGLSKNYIFQQLLGLLFGLALLISSGMAQAWGLDDAVAGIAQPDGGVARFTEIKYLSALDRPLRVQGEVRFTPPDQLQRLVTEPYRENMIVAGGMLSLQREDDKPRELALEDHPAIAAFVNAFLATLAGDKALLEKHYELLLEGDAGNWTLIMMPRDKSLARRVERIRVTGAGQRLVSFETRQANGDRSVMLFSLLARTSHGTVPGPGEAAN